MTRADQSRALPEVPAEQSQPRAEPAELPDEAVDAPEQGSGWTLRRLTVLLSPALVFLGIRELGLVVLAMMSSANHRVLAEVLWSWDGEWFLAIARDGYAGVPDTLRDTFGHRTPNTPLAFFPGYPKLVDALTHVPGLNLLTSALVVTTAAGVACAYGLSRLGTVVRGGSRRAGLALTALFAASPMGVVLSMAYSEALFCACAVWALVFTLQRRWVLAGVLCALAGLVRPTGAALLLAVGLAALVAVVTRRDGWRPWVCGLLAPAGLVGYLAWVGSRTGSWDGWFVLQRQGWDSSFDGGAATLKFSRDVLLNPPSVLEAVTVVLIVAALGLLAIGAVERVEWPLLVFAAGVLAMDLLSNGLMNSKARLMLPAFTLVVPVALALAKRRTPTLVITLGILAVASAWFGAYSLTSWQYAI